MVDPNTAPSAASMVDTSTPGVDRVTIQSDPAARAQIEGDKANQVTPTPAPAPAAEDGPQLPEGYDSWEAYGKDVATGKVKPATQESPTEETPAAQEGELTAEQTAEVESMLGQMPEAVREGAKPIFEEFAATGTLSDETKAAAAALFNATPEMVDVYMKGYQAQQSSEGDQMLATAGVTSEEFSGYKAWAESNLTVEERVAFNEGLNKDPSKTLADGIARWKESGQGPAARDITVGNPGGQATTTNTGPVGYASTQEMMRDQANPLYAKDPAFRARVEARIGASSFTLGRDVTGN